MMGIRVNWNRHLSHDARHVRLRMLLLEEVAVARWRREFHVVGVGIPVDVLNWKLVDWGKQYGPHILSEVDDWLWSVV